MPQPHPPHTHQKLSSLFKKMSTDLGQVAKEAQQRPAVKEFAAELRHTRADLKESAADIKAIAKDAAHDIKAVLKSTEAHLQAAHAPEASSAPAPVEQAAAPQAPSAEPEMLVLVTCEPAPAAMAAPEPETVEAMLTGLSTYDQLMVPDHG